MTTTTGPTPKPEITTDDKTPNLKPINGNQPPKTEITITDAQTPKPEPTGPIPPPDKPKQYRAIGLLRGRYVPSDEIERGTLITSDGSIIDAVVLGKLLGLLKARIDLDKEHLWVVYPRTRSKAPEKSLEESGKPVDTTTESTPKTEEPEEAPTDLFKEPTADSEPSPEEPEVPLDLSHGATGEDEFAGDDESIEEPEELPDLSELPAEDGKPNLHVQMAGIWEPETLHPDAPAPALEQKPDYFSIRGEVVYQHKEEGWVMVKIIQFSRRKPDEKPPYFNLKLLGFLPERPVKNFWNLDVEREGTDLVIQDGQRIAYLGKRKPKKGAPKKGKPRHGGGAGQKPAQAASPKEPPKLKKKQPAQ